VLRQPASAEGGIFSKINSEEWQWVFRVRGAKERATLCAMKMFICVQWTRFIVERNAPHTHLSLLGTKWLLCGGDSSLIAFAFFGFGLFQFQE